MTKTLKKGTKTSKFGASKRENHDASIFYSSKLYKTRKPIKKVESVENIIDEKTINKVFWKSSENMEELPEKSIHLMVTSPPYNVSKVGESAKREHLNVVITFK